MVDLEQVKQDNYIQQTLLGCPIGSSVDLQILAGLKSYRLYSKLIGIDGHQAILIRYGKGQEWQEAEPYLRSQQPIVLRILNETGFCQVLAFRTEVEATIPTPRKLLSIAFPRTLELAKLRQTTRVRLQEECEVRWQNPDPLAPPNRRPTELLDLSVSGCQIRSKLQSPFTKGAIIELHSETWGGVSLSGQIRNFRRGDQGHIYHGVEFMSLTNACESLIGRLMLKQLNTTPSELVT